jgi:hypothetical protein
VTNAPSRAAQSPTKKTCPSRAEDGSSSNVVTCSPSKNVSTRPAASGAVSEAMPFDASQAR